MAEPNEKLVRTTCPQCGTSLKAPASKVGRRLPCPACAHEIEVAASSIAASGGDVAGTPGDEYALREMTYAVQEPPPSQHSGAVIPVAGLPDELSGDRLAADEAPPDDEQVAIPSERPKLPRYPMFNGVLSFFFQGTAVICWSGFSVLVVVVLTFAYLGAQAFNAGRFGPVATFFMGLIAVVLTGMGLVASSGYLLAILQDSAAGNRMIINWPDAVFLDWIGGAVYLVVGLLVPVGTACVVALPFGGITANLWLVPLCVWLLFPIVHLSTLELQSPLLPVSPVVVESLWRCAGTWIVFFGQTFVMGLGIALLAAVVLLLNLTYFGFAMVGGVCIAAAMLYFRLLGRLAWVCDERFRQLREADEDEDEEGGGEANEQGGDVEIRPTPVDDF